MGVMQWMLMMFCLILMIWQWLMTHWIVTISLKGREWKASKGINSSKAIHNGPHTHSQYLMKSAGKVPCFVGELFQDLTQVTEVSIAWHVDIIQTMENWIVVQQ